MLSLLVVRAFNVASAHSFRAEAAGVPLRSCIHVFVQVADPDFHLLLFPVIASDVCPFESRLLRFVSSLLSYPLGYLDLVRISCKFVPSCFFPTTCYVGFLLSCHTWSWCLIVFAATKRPIFPLPCLFAY